MLIPLEREEIPLGVPLPWTLYDQTETPLIAEGEIIETGAQLDFLASCSPCRLLDDTTAAEAEALTGAKDTGNDVFRFEDMKLKVGDRLQLQPPSQLSPERFMVRLIGYQKGASLLVSVPLTANGLRLALQEGEKVVMRVFSGQNAFGFTSSVERVCKLPYEYMHLSFPEEVRGMIIRKAPRIRTRIIASVNAGDNGSEQVSGILLNLSANGACLGARKAVGQKGEDIRISFRVHLHNVDTYLTLPAAIRAVFVDENAPGTQANLIQHGLEFTDLPPNDSVILQSMIYQQLVENPHNIA